ncbi:MAG: hypothetical protein RL154_459 [Pseudomonadota bacterium]
MIFCCCNPKALTLYITSTISFVGNLKITEDDKLNHYDIYPSIRFNYALKSGTNIIKSGTTGVYYEYGVYSMTPATNLHFPYTPNNFISAITLQLNDFRAVLKKQIDSDNAKEPKPPQNVTTLRDTLNLTEFVSLVNSSFIVKV